LDDFACAVMLFGPKSSGKLRVQQHQPAWAWMIWDVSEMRSIRVFQKKLGYTWVYSDMLGYT
jgi:hypothetical protein